MSKEYVIHYLNNQIEVRTRKSAKLLLIFATDHMPKIGSSADPDIVRLHSDILPFFTAFVLAYNSRISAKAAHKSATAVIKNLLKDMSKNKVPAWDAVIQTLFPKKTAGYIALLPLGRKTLNKGKMDQRIQELAAFITNCGNDPKVAAIKTEAQTVYVAIDAARNLQQSKEGAAKDLSAAIEVASVNLSNYLYRNICFLAYKHYDNPKAVEAYFEFSHIRSKKTPKDDEPGSTFSVEIEPASTKEAGFAFEQTAKFYFYNYGEVPVTIFTGEEGATEPTGAYVLEPGAEADKPVSELGPIGSRYLYFANHDATLKATLEVVRI
jgi:hypothetical protein